MAWSPHDICGIMAISLLSIILSSQRTSSIKSGSPSGRSLYSFAADINQRLATQLKNLDVPFIADFESAAKSTDHIVDAIFGIIPTEKFYAAFSYKCQDLASLERFGRLLILL